MYEVFGEKKRGVRKYVLLLRYKLSTPH